MTHDPPFDVLRIEVLLWVAARAAHPKYTRGRYDCWVLCPRAHATAHLRCILELDVEATLSMDVVERYFDKYGRFFRGDDLVFAVGDIQ